MRSSNLAIIKFQTITKIDSKNIKKIVQKLAPNGVAQDNRQNVCSVGTNSIANSAKQYFLLSTFEL